MAVIGFGDLKQTTLPSLWDEDYLKKLELEDGTSFGAMVAEAQAALRMLTTEMTTMPHYSGLFAVDDQAELEYAIGVSNSWTEASEYTPPDPRRGKTTGHMLPIAPYDIGLGWTQMYMRRARAASMRADIQTIIDAGRNLWQQKALTRLFSSTANTVGTTSSDLGMADAAATDATYIPPVSPDGETFIGSHTHYLGSDVTGITASTLDQSALNVALEHLQEHGVQGPFELVGARVDAAEWSNTENVTGWKPPLWQGIAYQASAVERAMVSDMDNYFGFVETDYGIVRLWLTPRVPSDNFAVYKTFGPGNQRNPLRMRYRPSTGFGFMIVPGQYVNDPVSLAVGYTEFGFGTGPNRVAAVLVDVGASTWAAPTIA